MLPFCARFALVASKPYDVRTRPARWHVSVRRPSGRRALRAVALLLVLLLGDASALAGGGHGSASPRAAAATRVPAAPARLHALRLRLADGCWEAEGAVELRRGPCRWQAAALRRDARGALAAEYVRVMGCAREAGCDGPWIEALRLQGDGRGAWRAEALRAALCAAWPALRLEAPRAWLSARTGRLHLLTPRLRWGRLPLAWLPYLGLPTRVGTSGLLWPRVGYSGRDGLRLAQGGELVLGRHADARLTLGWIATRGVGLGARLRYFTRAHGDGALRLQLQQDAMPAPRWRGRLAGRLLLHGATGAVGLAPALVSDRLLLAELARAPALVFAPYARSRAWASTTRGPLVASVVADDFQPLSGGAARLDRPAAPDARREQGRVVVRVALLPLPVIGPLHLLGEAELARSGPLGVGAPAATGTARDAPSAMLPSTAYALTSWRVAPSLAAAGVRGPWSWSALAGYRLQALAGRAGEGETLRARQVAVSALALGLPLRRVWRRAAAGGSWIHGVEPFLAARARRGSSPSDIDSAASGLEPWVEAKGTSLALGVRSELIRLGGPQALARVLWAELALQLAPAAGGAPPLRALAGQLVLGPIGGLHGRVQARRGLARSEGWLLDSELCGAGGIFELCAGYLRVRAARAAALRLWDESLWPTEGSRLAALLGGAGDQLGASARSWRGGWRAELGLWVDPVARALTHARATLARAPLGACLSLSLGAELRAGQRWPDIVAQLGWRGPALADCGSW